MIGRLTCWLVLVSMLLAVPARPADQTWDFALSLLRDGDYFNGVGEFKRFLYLSPDAPRTERAELLMAVCYLRGIQYPACSEQCSLFLERHAESTYAQHAALLFLLSESGCRPSPASLDALLQGQLASHGLARQAALLLRGHALATGGD